MLMSRMPDISSHGLHVHSIIEGTKESLERLGLAYVDVIFAHRPDASGKVCVVMKGDKRCHAGQQYPWKRLSVLSIGSLRKVGYVSGVLRNKS